MLGTAGAFRPAMGHQFIDAGNELLCRYCRWSWEQQQLQARICGVRLTQGLAWLDAAQALEELPKAVLLETEIQSCNSRQRPFPRPFPTQAQPEPQSRLV